MILQLVLGAIAASLVTIKLYWAKFKSFLNRDRKDTNKLDSTNG
jgi:hypothetical protein